MHSTVAAISKVLIYVITLNGHHAVNHLASRSTVQCYSIIHKQLSLLLAAQEKQVRSEFINHTKHFRTKRKRKVRAGSSHVAITGPRAFNECSHHPYRYLGLWTMGSSPVQLVSSFR